MLHKRKLAISSLVILGAGSLAVNAVAQETTLNPEDEFSRPDVRELQQQIDELKSTVNSLTDEKRQADGEKADQQADKGFILTWEPGPVLSSADGRFSFELNGRMTYDYSIITFKDGDGTVRPLEKINGTNMRHLELGVRGKFLGSFSYRIATKFVDNEVDVKLAYIDYSFGNTTIVAGQTRTYTTLDKLTPPPNAAFAERAAFINALRINPQVGVGVSHHGENWSVSGGYFFENASTGNSSLDDNNMVSARLTFSPRLENGVGLHFGGSGFYRNENGHAYDLNYSARPFINQGDLKPLASTNFMVTGETFFDGEFVATYKSFGFQSEYGFVRDHLSSMETLTGTNPTYEGGYVEVSFFPTGGERVIDGKDGRYDNVKIANPVGAGGMGEVRVAARYDMADFTHEIYGRKQKSVIFAADWYLNELIKLQGNYAYTVVRDFSNVKTDIINSFNTRLMVNF